MHWVSTVFRTAPALLSQRLSQRWCNNRSMVFDVIH